MRLKTGLPDEGNMQDAGLEQALRDFRSSVHAWSEAEYSRPHQPERVVRLMSWRVAVGCALGCVLAAGSMSDGLYERHHRQELAKVAAAAEAARQQKLEAEQPAVQESDDLFAKVDSDVSRQVPRAMEPLAQLMTEDDEQ
jgi:hypothetical protein